MASPKRCPHCGKPVRPPRLLYCSKTCATQSRKAASSIANASARSEPEPQTRSKKRPQVPCATGPFWSYRDDEVPEVESPSEPTDRTILDAVLAGGGHLSLATLSQRLWPGYQRGRDLEWSRPPHKASAIEWLAAQVERLHAKRLLLVVQLQGPALAFQIQGPLCPRCGRRVQPPRFLYCRVACARRSRGTLCLQVALAEACLLPGKPQIPVEALDSLLRSVAAEPFVLRGASPPQRFVYRLPSEVFLVVAARAGWVEHLRCFRTLGEARNALHQDLPGEPLSALPAELAALLNLGVWR